MGSCRAEDAQAAGGTADEEGGADAAWVPTATDEGIGGEASGEVAEGGNQPGDAGVEERVEEIDMEGGGEIAGEPGEEEVEDVVVGAEAEGETEDLLLADEVGEGGLWGFGMRGFGGGGLGRCGGSFGVGGGGFGLGFSLGCGLGGDVLLDVG